MKDSKKLVSYYKGRKAKKVENNFSYNSKNNKIFLSINELRKLIKNL